MDEKTGTESSGVTEVQLNNDSYYSVSTPSSDMYTDFLTTTLGYINATLINLEDAPKTQKATLKLYDYLIPSIGALVIALNLAVVVSSGLILKKGQQPRSTYLFLGNVAMTDLVTGVAVVFGQMYPKEHRNLSICAIQIGMIVSSTLASVYSVGLIAVDRFLYIIHGLQYQRWVYPFRARICILSSWVIGLLIGFLPLMGWHGETDNGRICWFILLAPKNLIFLTVIVGAIPLMTVVVLYSVILYHAIKKIIQIERSVEEETRHAPQQNQNDLRMFRGRGSSSGLSEDDDRPVALPKEKNVFRKIFGKKPNNKVPKPSKWKAIKVVMFTSGSFVLTWGPYFVASIIYTYCDDQTSKKCKHLSILIASPLAILGFVNSLINPIIYAWWHKGFRTFLQKRWDSMRNRRRSTSRETTSTSGRKTSSSSENAAKLTAVNMKTTPDLEKY